MKKYLPYIIILFMGVTACQKNNDKADLGDPDKRLNTLLADYESKLVAAPHGWIMTILPDTGYNTLPYIFWFKFNDSNRVASRWKELPAFTSSYRLKALQRPELIFDTYTYLHELSNPEPYTLPNTESGKGLYSDFEFEILSASADSFMLLGKYNGSTAKLVKADSDTEELTVPGYTLAGVYLALVDRKLYQTTIANGTVTGEVFDSFNKTAMPQAGMPETVAVDYADLGASGWAYLLTFDKATQTLSKVEANATMNAGIAAGSFKVLVAIYDASSGKIYLETSYTNTAGAERLTDEVLTLQ